MDTQGQVSNDVLNVMIARELSPTVKRALLELKSRRFAASRDSLLLRICFRNGGAAELWMSGELSASNVRYLKQSLDLTLLAIGDPHVGRYGDEDHSDLHTGSTAQEPV